MSLFYELYLIWIIIIDFNYGQRAQVQNPKEMEKTQKRAYWLNYGEASHRRTTLKMPESLGRNLVLREAKEECFSLPRRPRSRISSISPRSNDRSQGQLDSWIRFGVVRSKSQKKSRSWAYRWGKSQKEATEKNGIRNGFVIRRWKSATNE